LTTVAHYQMRATWLLGAMLERVCMRKINDKARAAKSYAKHREKYLAKAKAQREEDPTFAAKKYRISREWLAARPGRAAQQQREWQIRNPRKWKISQMHSAASRRAKDLGIPFTITKDDIANVYGDVCPVFGKSFEVAPGASGTKRDFSPSLDRIVPSLGYQPDNIIVVSDLANRIKSNATPTQVAQVAEFYIKLEVGKK
jgi:hypothetical protein